MAIGAVPAVWTRRSIIETIRRHYQMGSRSDHRQNGVQKVMTYRYQVTITAEYECDLPLDEPTRAWVAHQAARGVPVSIAGWRYDGRDEWELVRVGMAAGCNAGRTFDAPKETP